MSYRGLDRFNFGCGVPAGRDGIVEELLAGRLDAESAARDRELDELIAAGWGHVPGRLIPPDWREREPPAQQGRWAGRDGGE
jgi:hypothetical protein